MKKLVVLLLVAAGLAFLAEPTARAGVHFVFGVPLPVPAFYGPGYYYGGPGPYYGGPGPYYYGSPYYGYYYGAYGPYWRSRYYYGNRFYRGPHYRYWHH
jgi:hypothetical protein